MWIGGREQMSEKFLRGIWERLVEVHGVVIKEFEIVMQVLCGLFFFF